MKMTRAEFVDYLENDVLPLLREDGWFSLTKDIEASVSLIKNPKQEEVIIDSYE